MYIKEKDDDEIIITCNGRTHRLTQPSSAVVLLTTLERQLNLPKNYLKDFVGTQYHYDGFEDDCRTIMWLESQK
ncbi:hypothetical protein QTO12_05890 [Vibrio owensii]|uniref:hypothetical protein n=1 Tax=Vibrio owensii TaxID=696485 RepID=UPI002F4143B0